MRARLRQEARAAAALSHPSIATVFALEEIGDQIFIVSEYLEGRTLREEMKSRSLRPARAIEIARTIAAALLAAHDRGIVHRDLKPENIIITPSGGVKILDFGLAQFDVAAQDLASVTHLTDPGAIAGTPPYMAPEQLLGQPTSARTDQFAFGVLFYEMLTGRHPFGTGGLPTTIAKTLAAYPDRPEIDGELWSVISRMLEKNPNDRFPSTKALVAALAGDFPGIPVTSLSPGTGLRPRKTLRARHDAIVERRDELVDDAPTDRGAGLLVHGVARVAGSQMDRPLRRPRLSRDAGDRRRWRQCAAAFVVYGAHLSRRAHLAARQYQPPRAGADVAFSLVMIATGLVIADAHTGGARCSCRSGWAGALAFLVIEPATARRRFRKIDGSRSEIRDLRIRDPRSTYGRLG
jgi:hypothetical protein